ncbi:gp53-like domain-containing protein [Serratia nevei]|uniref:gp53-like domain-containing protein n=1 Tax=Serratia nevei TaxID=2703794 RepID=UPI003F7CE827
MHRIDTPTAQIDKFGPGKNGFTNGNPATGRRATDLNSDMWDAVQEEVANAIEGNGISLDKSKHNQLYLAIQKAITDPGFLKKANNLSDVDNVPEARGNLGLGTAATKNVGTSTGNVMEVGAFGLGAASQNKSDAYQVLSQIYRVLNTAANRPGNSIYGVISLRADGPDDGGRSGYFAAGVDGSAYVGLSDADKIVRWSRIYTTAYKPTAADVNAYTKQEADSRFVYKSGDTISWLNVLGALRVDGNIANNSRGFIVKNGFGDIVNNSRTTSGLRINGAADLAGEIYFLERVNQHHLIGFHVTGAGADKWFEFRSTGETILPGSVTSAGGALFGGNVTVSHDGRSASYQENGDVNGAIWGGYLSNYINNIKNSANKSTNGWFKDSVTGVIIQWGAFSANRGDWITYPIQFPSYCAAINITDTGGNGNAGGAEGRTNVGFVLKPNQPSLAGTYIAIGY